MFTRDVSQEGEGCGGGGVWRFLFARQVRQGATVCGKAGRGGCLFF